MTIDELWAAYIKAKMERWQAALDAVKDELAAFDAVVEMELRED